MSEPAPGPRSAAAGAARAGLVLAALLGACAVDDVVATTGDCTGAGCAPDDRDLYCRGEGPPVLVGDGAGGVDICSGDLAEATFRFALCTCESYSASASLVSDAFDSADGPYAPGGAGGSVGINRAFDTVGDVVVGGSLVVGGAGGILGGPRLEVAGDLFDGGGLGRASTEVTVGGNAQVAGDVDLAALTVGGRLTLPSEATLAVATPPAVGELVRAPVTFAPPCGCAASDLLDVAGYVEAHRFANHNAAIGLSLDAANGFAGPLRLELPCGRFFLSRLAGDGPLTLVVSGRTALFIPQGISLQQDFTVELQPNAELDLFVAGHIELAGDVQLGSAAAPARVRVYIGGGGALALSATSVFGGNLYAPLIDLQTSAGAEVFGSVFVNRVAASGPLALHYDERIRSASTGCVD